MEVKDKMPIYEYQCSTCGHTFEVLQRFSDEPIKECCRCSASVQRLISPPALVFKGGGWYVNEFPSKDREKGIQGEKGNGDGAGKKAQDEAKSTVRGKSKSE